MCIKLVIELIIGVLIAVSLVVVISKLLLNDDNIEDAILKHHLNQGYPVKKN